ncbi:TIR-NBS-LRR resistance protein, partial [Trifolium medium]|nr:TIR-NBS-LRR resistance protein [Trifolium medium]
LSENNYDWQDNFDETKNPEETLNIQGGKNIVPDTNNLINEQEQENAPRMNLSKPEGEEGGSDVDPFAELESILSGSPESSPKATD